MNINEEKKQTFSVSFEFLRLAMVIYKRWLEDAPVFYVAFKMSIPVQLNILNFYKSIFIKEKIICQVEKQHSN